MTPALASRLLRALFLLTVLLITTTARADEWWGRDKGLHFGISAAIGASAYAGSALIWSERWPRATCATAVALSVGAGKELWDLSGRGDPSWKDFTWDVAGTAVGVGLALVVDALLRPESPRSPRREQAALAFHF